MYILRKLATYIAYALLPTTLITFGILFSIHQALGSPRRVEAALDQSGIYDTVAASVVKQATSNQATDLDASGQQAVQSAVGDAMSPDYIKSQTNGALQGIYDWLQGKTEAPTFSIDLTSVKDKLATTMSQEAERHAASLPACTGSDYATTGSDPFSLTCLPQGETPAQVGEQARQQVLSSEFYKTGTLTPANLSQNGRSLQDRLQPVADAYHAVWLGLVWTGITAVVLVAVLIGLTKPWQQGTRRVAKIFLTIGITSAAMALIAGWLMRTVSDKLAEQHSANAEMQSKAVKVIQLLTADLRNWWAGFGVVLVALGIAGLVVARAKKATPPQSVDRAGGSAEPTLTTKQKQHEHNADQPPADTQIN